MTNRTKTGYALKNVLSQAPEKVKSSVLAIGGAIVIIFGVAGYSVSGEIVAAGGVIVERLLDLFYVAPIKKGAENQALQDLNDHTLGAIDLGKQLARTRPLVGDTHVHGEAGAQPRE